MLDPAMPVAWFLLAENRVHPLRWPSGW